MVATSFSDVLFWSGASSVLMESEPKLYRFHFDAFSLREPESTSLENAMLA
jgi:hypothetical protein